MRQAIFFHDVKTILVEETKVRGEAVCPSGQYAARTVTLKMTDGSYVEIHLFGPNAATLSIAGDVCNGITSDGQTANAPA